MDKTVGVIPTFGLRRGIVALGTITAIGSMLVTACTDVASDGVDDPAVAGLIAAALETRAFGEEYGDPGEWFTFIVSATISDDRIIVADMSPPFLRVWDSAGRLEALMAEEGQGPHEVSLVHGVAATGDTIGISHQGRLMTWTRDGAPISNHVIGPARSVAVTTGCGGHWYVYGPHLSQQALESTEPYGWLHLIRMDRQEGSMRTLAYDTVAVARRGFGKLTLAATERHLAWFHENGDPPTLTFFDCGSEGRLVARWRKPYSELTQLGDVSGTGRDEDNRYEIHSNTAVHGGLAVVGPYVLIAQFAFDDNRLHTTFFHLVSEVGERVATVAVPGRFRLFDADEEVGILMGTSEPFPQLFIIPTADLLDAIAGSVS